MNIAYRICTLGLLLVTVACASSRQRTQQQAGEPTPTYVRVDNQASADMNIYVLRQAGNRVRLGTATAHTSTTFRIPDQLLFGITPLRFLADPIGSSRTPVSEEIMVTPGDSVILTIPPGG